MRKDDGPAPPLRERIFKGLAWSLLQSWGSRLITLLVYIVLARLLAPAEFGIVTAAYVLLGILLAVLDLGVADVLVRRRPQDWADYDSAFWTLLGFALLLAVATVAAAQSLATLLRQPKLPPLLWILAVTLPVSVLEIVQGARMRSQMLFKPLAQRTLAAAAAGGAVGIALAAAGAGYWSLLAKGLIETLVSTALLWRACDYRPGRQHSWARWRELFASGKHLLASRLLDIVNQRLDSLIVSARLGVVPLGLYAAGQRVYATLIDALFTTVNRVALPAFAELQQDKPRLQRALLQLVSLMSFFTFPIFAFVAIAADPLTVTLFGAPWAASAPILSAFCVGGLLYSVSYFNSQVMTAVGRADLVFRLTIVSALVNSIGFGVGSSFGAVGVAAAFSLRGYLMLPLNLQFLRRSIDLEPGRWLSSIAPPLLATLATAAAVLSIARLLPDALAPALRLLALAAAFTLLHVFVAVTLIPDRTIAALEGLAAFRPGLQPLADVARRWRRLIWRR